MSSIGMPLGPHLPGTVVMGEIEEIGPMEGMERPGRMGLLEKVGEMEKMIEKCSVR